MLRPGVAPEASAANDAGSVPAPDGSARAEAGSPDFAAVLEGCDATIQEVGDEAVVVALAERGGRVAVTIGRFSEAALAFTDLETVTLELDRAAAGEARVTGKAFGAARVTLSTSCAPSLEKPGQPIECLEAALERRGGAWRVTGPPRWVSAGGPVDPNYLAPGESPPPLVRAWARQHPGCRLNARVATVQARRGPLAYASGCPRDEDRGRAPSACGQGCQLLWQAAAGPVGSAPLAANPLLTLEGSGLFALDPATAGGAARALFVDGDGAHEVRLPAGSTSSYPDAMADERGEVWLELGDQLYRASAPAFAWQRACPSAACRVAVRDGHAPRWLFAIEDGQDRRLLQREPDGRWTSFLVPSPESSLREVVHAGHTVWMRTLASSGGSPVWWRLGPTVARVRCATEGPNVLERVEAPWASASTPAFHEGAGASPGEAGEGGP